MLFVKPNLGSDQVKDIAKECETYFGCVLADRRMAELIHPDAKGVGADIEVSRRAVGEVQVRDRNEHASRISLLERWRGKVAQADLCREGCSTIVVGEASSRGGR